MSFRFAQMLAQPSSTLDSVLSGPRTGNFALQLWILDHEQTYIGIIRGPRCLPPRSLEELYPYCFQISIFGITVLNLFDPQKDPWKSTKMYHPELTRFTRIFLASRRPTLPGFHHIDGCRVQISPDFTYTYKKCQKNVIFALVRSRLYLTSCGLKFGWYRSPWDVPQWCSIFRARIPLLAPDFDEMEKTM